MGGVARLGLGPRSHKLGFSRAKVGIRKSSFISSVHHSSFQIDNYLLNDIGAAAFSALPDGDVEQLVEAFLEEVEPVALAFSAGSLYGKDNQVGAMPNGGYLQTGEFYVRPASNPANKHDYNATSTAGPHPAPQGTVVPLSSVSFTTAKARNRVRNATAALQRAVEGLPRSTKKRKAHKPRCKCAGCKAHRAKVTKTKRAEYSARYRRKKKAAAKRDN
jgi:hypothetical protein